MTVDQWKIFCSFKNDLKNQIEKWQKCIPNLCELQQEAAKIAKTPNYPFETTIVYNRALDEITQNDDIKLIVIGDNPGKDEQLAKNNKYLVGQAGKIGEGFFRRNAELQIDFRKNVIILNKTPIHSAKTAQLKTIAKLGGHKTADFIKETQIWMAQKTAKLHCDLCNCENVQPELWLVGYSELKQKGIFSDYRNELKTFYEENAPLIWQKVFVFQHFSMNRFTIDLANYIEKNDRQNESLYKNLHEIGTIHKKEIFD